MGSGGRWVGRVVARAARCTVRGFCLSRTFVYVHTCYEYCTHASLIGSKWFTLYASAAQKWRWR
jgi:hypothetical protein